MLGTIIIAGWMLGFAAFAIEAARNASADNLDDWRSAPWMVFAIMALWPVTRPLAIVLDWREGRL